MLSPLHMSALNQFVQIQCHSRFFGVCPIQDFRAFCCAETDGKFIHIQGAAFMCRLFKKKRTQFDTWYSSQFFAGHLPNFSLFFRERQINCVSQFQIKQEYAYTRLQICPPSITLPAPQCSYHIASSVRAALKI